jgi:hypothetical protein
MLVESYNLSAMNFLSLLLLVAHQLSTTGPMVLDPMIIRLRLTCANTVRSISETLQTQGREGAVWHCAHTLKRPDKYELQSLGPARNPPIQKSPDSDLQISK